MCARLVKFAADIVRGRYGAAAESLITEQLCNAHAEGDLGAPQGTHDMARALQVLDHLKTDGRYMTQGMFVVAQLRVGLIRAWTANASVTAITQAPHTSGNAPVQFEVVNFPLATDVTHLVASFSRAFKAVGIAKIHIAPTASALDLGARAIAKTQRAHRVALVLGGERRVTKSFQPTRSGAALGDDSFSRRAAAVSGARGGGDSRAFWRRRGGGGGLGGESG